MMDQSNIRDILERLSILEKRERKNADEILILHKENKDLMTRVQMSDHKYEDLRLKVASLENAEKENISVMKTLLQGNKSLKNLVVTVTDLQKEMKNQENIEDQRAELDKIRRVLNRAFIQSQQKAKMVEVREKKAEEKFRKEKDDLMIAWKKEKSKGDDQLWGKIHDLEGKIKEMEDHARSIFCAKLLQYQSHRDQVQVKMSICPSVIKLSSKIFTSKSGLLNPEEEGVYSLSWNFHQGSAGKIKYFLKLNGAEGKIKLGLTNENDDVCSGTLVIPLQKNQKVGVEAQRVEGNFAKVASCNFMGWLLKKCPVDSLGDITKMYPGLTQPQEKAICRLQ